MSIYLQLLLSFMKVGLFGFGGGYAMLSLLQEEIVSAPHNWLTLQEFTDIVAISQLTPGPVMINSATYVGYVVTGTVWGSILATIGVCIPPTIIMLIFSKFYLKFHNNKYMEMIFSTLKPATVGLILAAAISLVTRENFIDIYSLLFFIAAFIATYKKVDAIKLIVCVAVIGILLY